MIKICIRSKDVKIENKQTYKHRCQTSSLDSFSMGSWDMLTCICTF